MRRHAARLLATSLHTQLASVDVQPGLISRRNRNSLLIWNSVRAGRNLGGFEIQGGAEVIDSRKYNAVRKSLIEGNTTWCGSH